MVLDFQNRNSTAPLLEKSHETDTSFEHYSYPSEGPLKGMEKLHISIEPPLINHTQRRLLLQEKEEIENNPPTSSNQGQFIVQDPIRIPAPTTPTGSSFPFGNTPTVAHSLRQEPIKREREEDDELAIEERLAKQMFPPKPVAPQPNRGQDSLMATPVPESISMETLRRHREESYAYQCKMQQEIATQIRKANLYNYMEQQKAEADKLRFDSMCIQYVLTGQIALPMQCSNHKKFKYLTRDDGTKDFSAVTAERCRKQIWITKFGRRLVCKDHYETLRREDNKGHLLRFLVESQSSQENHSVKEGSRTTSPLQANN